MNFIGELAALATSFFFAMTRPHLHTDRANGRLAGHEPDAPDVRVDLSCDSESHPLSRAAAIFCRGVTLTLAGTFRIDKKPYIFL